MCWVSVGCIPGLVILECHKALRSIVSMCVFNSILLEILLKVGESRSAQRISPRKKSYYQ